MVAVMLKLSAGTPHRLDAKCKQLRRGTLPAAASVAIQQQQRSRNGKSKHHENKSIQIDGKLPAEQMPQVSG